MRESKDLSLLISEEAILNKIASLAKQLDQRFHNDELVIIMILKGSICFASDLIRRLQVPFTLETITCQSYGLKGSERGELKVLGLEGLNLASKHVLLIDDIFDTGHTLSTVVQRIQQKNPSTLTSAVLLAKPSKHLVTMKPDYVLFSVEDHFVIGYGLDFNEHYRGLRGIYKFS